jgi:hypothetical protein
MSAVAARILAVPSFMADPALLKCASAALSLPADRSFRPAGSRLPMSHTRQRAPRPAGHTETLNYQYAADPSQLAATRTRRPNLAAFFPVTMTNRLWPL